HDRGAAFTPQRRPAGERLWKDPTASARSTALRPEGCAPNGFRSPDRQRHLAHTTGARRSRRRLLCELEEGDDALGQLAVPEAEHFLERQGLFDVELSGRDAAQRDEMSAATELAAQIVRERAHIRALGATDAEAGKGLLVIAEAETVDVDEPRLALHLDPAPREFVERDALDLDGRDHGRGLHLIAEETLGRFVELG